MWIWAAIGIAICLVSWFLFGGKVVLWEVIAGLVIGFGSFGVALVCEVIDETVDKILDRLRSIDDRLKEISKSLSTDIEQADEHLKKISHKLTLIKTDLEVLQRPDSYKPGFLSQKVQE